MIDTLGGGRNLVKKSFEMNLILAKILSDSKNISAPYHLNDSLSVDMQKIMGQFNAMSRDEILKSQRK
jgi:hypothetical protein